MTYFIMDVIILYLTMIDIKYDGDNIDMKEIDITVLQNLISTKYDP